MNCMEPTTSQNSDRKEVNADTRADQEWCEEMNAKHPSRLQKRLDDVPRMASEPKPDRSETYDADGGSTREPLPDIAWCEHLIEAGVSPQIARAQVRHRRDLAELLPEHHGAWVAYKGDERLEIGTSKTNLYRKYLDQGLRRDELLVLCVEPDLFDDEVDFSIPT